MAKLISMAATTLLLGMLMASLEITGVQSIGVCYGRNGNNLPLPPEVVALYEFNKIGQMRIYHPDQPILEALRNSNIEVALDVYKEDLPNLANDPNEANSWVQTNVRNYWPSVKFRYIVVGNEIATQNTGTSQYVQFLVRAMQNIHNALRSDGLHTQIKLSTATYNDIFNQTFPPSNGIFRDDAQDFMRPIVSFLGSIGSPILVNVYPYFAFTTGDPNIKLSYALFNNKVAEFTDSNNGLVYHNLFDAMVDAAYAALEKMGGSNLEIVVSESGWPSAGHAAASVDNARTYNQNLINHVKMGTPKRPGRAIETYIFAMFNENLKEGEEQEKNFGLFFPNRQPVYQINFS